MPGKFSGLKNNTSSTTETSVEDESSVDTSNQSQGISSFDTEENKI